MTDKVLQHAVLKTARAAQRIKELEDLVARADWQAAKVFAVDQAAAAQGRQAIQLQLSPPVHELPLLLGEAVYHLRSALDVAVIDLARRHKPGCGTGDVNFPFASTQEELMKLGSKEKPGPQWLIRKLSQPARDFINGLKPFPAGNPDLCGLNKLRNRDAHVELTPTATSLGTTNLIRFSGNLSSLLQSMAVGTIGERLLKSGELRDGLTIDVSDLVKDAALAAEIANKHIELHVQPSFGPSVAFENHPVIPTLHRLHQTVEDILKSLQELA